MWLKDIKAKAEDIIICSKAWAELQAAISEHQNLYSALCSLQKMWDHMRKRGVPHGLQNRKQSYHYAEPKGEPQHQQLVAL